jgi:hypothetical protein
LPGDFFLVDLRENVIVDVKLTEKKLEAMARNPAAHRRRWTTGSHVGERWSSRLVATAAEDRLRSSTDRFFVKGS